MNPGKKTFPVSAVKMRRSRSTFTSRSCNVWFIRSTRPFSEELRQVWNKTLKAELGERFESPADAKTKLFDYIEVFYNQQRRHSTLGYLSPAAFERAAVKQVA